MEREKKEAEEEEKADDALTKAAIQTVRGHIKRLRDDPSDDDNETKPLTPPPLPLPLVELNYKT